MKFSKILSVMLALVMILGTSLTAVSAMAEETTLVIPVWSPVDYDKLAELKLVDRVKEATGVTIELELLKEVEYENDMKIRKNAAQLPDVFPLQGKWLTVFQEDLADLSGLTALSNHITPDALKVGDIVPGIPQSQFNEFVYYRKSVFAENGLTVPTTWPQLIEACQKIKEAGKVIPWLMGAKDEWPDYPLNEFMPSVVAQNGDYWSTFADSDAPFAKDQPIYKAYERIQQLYDAKVFGDDPLGIGWDQSVDMFAAGEGAIIAGGSWLLDTLKTKMDSTDDVGAFIMPMRDADTDPLYTTSMMEYFWCINKSAKNPEAAQKFVEFWFSDAWYPEYIKSVGLTPTIKGVEAAIDPMFVEALAVPGLQFISYKDGSEAFMNIRNAMQFDVKKIGVAMMQESRLDAMMEDLNAQWKDARAAQAK